LPARRRRGIRLTARSIPYAVGIGEQESTGAKAGRYVRAAGLALGASARELRKGSEAAPEPVPVAPPPPPPPAPRTGGLVGRLVFYGFVCSFVAFVLVVLRFELLLGHTTARTVFRLALAGVLLGEAWLLLSNWRGANERLGQRVLAKAWGARGPVTRGERIFARVLRDALTLIGIVFLATAVFELLSATVGT